MTARIPTERHYSPLGFYMEYPQERFLWDGLRKRWPQLNEKSTVMITTVYDVNLPEGSQLSQIWENSWEYVGHWKRGVKAWFWRVLGALFNEPAWFGKDGGGLSIIAEKERVIPKLFTKYRTVKLERYGYIMRYAPDHLSPVYAGWQPREEEIRIAAGYDVLTDTLFINFLGDYPYRKR